MGRVYCASGREYHFGSHVIFVRLFEESSSSAELSTEFHLFRICFLCAVGLAHFSLCERNECYQVSSLIAFGCIPLERVTNNMNSL